MKYRFLLSNDDGYQAKGLNNLIELLRPLGEVIVLAPDGPRSGFSSSITLTQPLRLKLQKEEENLKVYSITGTPTDCVKLALATLFKEEKPTMVITGINHGSNDGVSVHYSGTLGSAREGAIAGIPALATSINHEGSNPDISEEALAYIKQIIQYMLEHLDEKPFLSLNLPKGAIKGLRVCPHAVSVFVDEFVQREDGYGKSVYWMTGVQILPKGEAKSDIELMRSGYATLTPLTLDQTDYKALEKLSKDF